MHAVLQVSSVLRWCQRMRNIFIFYNIFSVDESKVPESRTSELVVDHMNNTDAGQSEEAHSDEIDESKDENREAEAYPSNNTRQRTAVMSSSNVPLLRGATARRSTRTSFRTVHGNRPTPIVWDSQSSSRGKDLSPWLFLIHLTGYKAMNS